MKCIAIGNRIMGDDGIGIRVLEETSSSLEKEGIYTVVGETDAYFAISMIEDGDFLFILDSAFYEKEPGSLTLIPIGEYITYSCNLFSQHESSFIDLLKSCGKTVEGWIIGIEVKSIEFRMGLSIELEKMLPNICREVVEKIFYILGG